MSSDSRRGDHDSDRRREYARRSGQREAEETRSRKRKERDNDSHGHHYTHSHSHKYYGDEGDEKRDRSADRERDRHRSRHEHQDTPAPPKFVLRRADQQSSTHLTEEQIREEELKKRRAKLQLWKLAMSDSGPSNPSPDRPLTLENKKLGPTLSTFAITDDDKPKSIMQRFDYENEAAHVAVDVTEDDDDNTNLLDDVEVRNPREGQIDEPENDDLALPPSKRRASQHLGSNFLEKFVSEQVPVVPAAPHADGDDVDPLDAFMAGLSSELARDSNSRSQGENSAVVADAEDADATSELLDAMTTEEDDSKKSGRKLLEAVDHSKINYSLFKKDFYVEVPEISQMSKEEVEASRAALDGLRIRGKDCPKPIKTFAQAGLSSRILEFLRLQGYEKPTPIQAQAIPAILSGRDVIGIAKTGSGKTLAFLLPMFRHILDQPPVRPGDGPIALIMAPTRELATQIHSEIKKFKRATALSSVCVYGGAGVASQIGDLKRGAEIVVCTPGRMIDILAANKGRITNLRRVTYLVLDEADRMFDLGFEQQILRIIQNIRPDRQTVMFSATFPRTVEAAARKILRLPVEITVHGRSVVSDQIEQIVEVIPEETKFDRLMQLIAEWYSIGSTIIFVDRQNAADDLFSKLVNSGYICRALHGGIDQEDRDETIRQFKSGEVKILVATSVASRGLDVPSCRLVINFDVPNHLEDYVHRVGRTGRAGNTGTAVTFVCPDEEVYAPDIVRALKDAKREVPERLQKMADEFLEKKKSGQARGHRTGFDGRGFSFTEAEERKRQDAAKMQAKLFGGELAEGLDDDEEVASNSDDDAAPPATALPTGQTDSKLDTSGIKAVTKGSDIGPVGDDKMTALFAKLASAADPEAAARAQQKARELQEKNELARKALANMQGPVTVATHYETEIEINDYPQSVRWKVTHKDAVRAVVDETDCAITVKGTFVPSGVKAPAGDRKLYLLLEGSSVESVAKAKAEIMKRIEEAMLNVRPDQVAPGRYQVL